MNFKGFLDILSVAGTGWASVFAVILVIWATIAMMLKLFGKKEDDED